MSSPEIILSSSAAQDSSSATSAAIPIPSKSTNSWGDIDFSMSNTGLYTPSYVGSFGSAQESVLSNWGNTEDQSSLNPLTSDMDMQDPRLFDSLNADDDYVPDYDVDQPSTSPFHMIEQDFNTLSGATDLVFSEDMSRMKSAVPGSAGIYSGDLFSSAQDMAIAQVYSNVSPSSSLNDLHRERDLNNRSRASSSASSFQDHSSPSFGMAHDFSTSNQINEQLGRLTFDQSSYPNISTSTPDISHTTPSPPGASSPQIQPPISPPHLVIPGDSSAASVPPILAGNLPPFGPPQNAGPGGPSIEILPATPVNTSDAATRNTLHFLLQNTSNTTNGPVVTNSRGRPTFVGNNAFQVSARAGNVSTDQTSDSAATEDAVWSSVTAFHQQSKNTAMGSGASAVGQTPTTLPHPPSYHHGYNIPALPAFNPPDSTSSKSQQGSEPAPINLPSLPPFSHTQSAPTVGTSDPQQFNNTLYSRPDLGQHQPSPSSPEFLLSTQGHSRSRSFSDTSSRPSPSFWDPSLTSTPMNTNDFGSRPSTSSSISSSHLGMMGGPTLNMPDMMNPLDVPMDTSMNYLPNNNSPSRSNSQRHKRGVKSEDLTPLRSPALLHNVLAPESDYVKSIKIDGSLAPFDPRMNSDPSMGGGMYFSSGMAGPTRRRGSSSGHDRVGSVTSLRATPYTRPSPHASPAPSPHHSPNLGGQNLPGVADIHSQNNQQHQTIQPIMKVERALVTTPATKTASANRRRAEASFVCPVPGCGSTFTRHFNLRGHLRSHNEERPFKCKWPGCEKGFARQHDCKRHEALHLNIRPYTCEGCQKTFARMDALNRHLRSEGGIDCQKHHKLDGLTSFASDSNDPIAPKQEPEWSGKRGPIMM